MPLSASKLLLVCSFIVFLSQQLSASIAPQAGESVWAIIQKIGQHLDEGKDFAETWTAINSSTNSIEQALDKDFAETWTAIHAVEYSDPLYTPIQNSDASGGTITISQSDNYKLVESLSCNIYINANEVTLDLNGYTVYSGTGFAIEIAGGKKNITIQNGWIVPLDTGIYLDSNGIATHNLYFNNIQFEGGNKGIYLMSQNSGGLIKNCHISNCTFTNTPSEYRGIVFKAATKALAFYCFVDDCTITMHPSSNTTSYGVLIESVDAQIYNCHLNNCTVLSAIYDVYIDEYYTEHYSPQHTAFYLNASDDGKIDSVLFNNCKAYTGDYAFHFSSNTGNNLLKHCVANGVYTGNSYYMPGGNHQVECLAINGSSYIWKHTIV